MDADAPIGFLRWRDRIAASSEAFVNVIRPQVLLADGRDAATMLKHASDHLFDAILQHTLERAVETAVCRPGCHRCCSINLEASWYEAMAIAIHVDLTMPKSDERLRRIDAYAEELRAMTSDDRLSRSTMCPFLLESDGMCSIYPLRPLLCRAHYVAAGGECGTGVPVNMLLGPKVAASVVDQAISGIVPPPEGVEPFTEFVTAVLFHTDRLTGRRDPRPPVPPLGHEIDDKIGPQTVIFDPESREATHD